MCVWVYMLLLCVCRPISGSSGATAIKLNGPGQMDVLPKQQSSSTPSLVFTQLCVSQQGESWVCLSMFVFKCLCLHQGCGDASSSHISTIQLDYSGSVSLLSSCLFTAEVSCCFPEKSSDKLAAQTKYSEHLIQTQIQALLKYFLSVFSSFSST